MANRSYCFTFNNPGDFFSIPEHEDVRYVIFQKEKGESGTIHIQGYVELKKTRRIAWMQENFLRGAHYETRRGTREQAREYCRKTDTRIEDPIERGQWENGGAGARNDLHEIKRKLDAGIEIAEIYDQHFETSARHYRFFNEYKRSRTQHRQWKTEVYVFWGESGTGKTRRVSEMAPKAYWKTRDEWWDRYDGEEDVVMDDFYGWIPWDLLLRLLDRYPLDVNAKGGGRRMVAKRVFITSNKPPEEWYPNIPDKTPLLRRIEHKVHFNKSL